MRDVIVIGGGPSGSTFAAAAAQAGLDVLLLEAGRHPRPHVGESLLPGILPILARIGALDAIEAAGFGPKTGSTHWRWGKTPEWDLWFEETEAYPKALFVERARFDAILFENAARAGAEVRSDTPARLWWEGARAAGVRWSSGGVRREARARWVIDARGQAGGMGERAHLPGLRHRALWAHFRGAKRLPPPRSEQALFVAGGSHWAWLFPLDAETTSVGFVLRDHAPGPPEAAYDGLLEATPELAPLLAGASRSSPVRVERDWSYRMAPVAGPGWLAVGDAAGFIDPVLSTGVLLAMHSGWHGAECVGRALRGECTEEETAAEYQNHHGRMFEDLLRIVRFFYSKGLHREGYFWESKRILEERLPAVRPQKAFLILTSGLVDNLAFDATRKDAEDRRAHRALRGAPLALEPPDELAFVCLHLRHLVDPPAALFFLIEENDPAEPALFRTENWALSCMAPRYGNDPILVPALAPTLRQLNALLARLDDRPGEPLAAFWSRVRGELESALSALPPHLELLRVFGE